MYVPSSELGLSQSLSRQRVCPSPPEPWGEGGGHTRLRVRGRGCPNSDDSGKSLALCLLCGLNHFFYLQVISSRCSATNPRATAGVWRRPQVDPYPAPPHATIHLTAPGQPGKDDFQILILQEDSISFTATVGLLGVGRVETHSLFES